MSLDIDLLATGQTHNVKTILNMAAKMKRMGNLEDLTAMIERFVPHISYDDQIAIEQFYRHRTREYWKAQSLQKYLDDHRSDLDPKSKNGRISNLLVSKINRMVRHEHMNQSVVSTWSIIQHVSFAHRYRNCHLRITRIRMQGVQLHSIKAEEKEIRWIDRSGHHRIYMHYDWMYQSDAAGLNRLFSSEYISFPSRLIRRLSGD